MGFLESLASVTHRRMVRNMSMIKIPSPDQDVGSSSAGHDRGRFWTPMHKKTQDHPVATLIAGRLLLGVVTLWIVSILIFIATAVLPGNAAVSILGQSATPDSVRAMEQQLHLNEPVLSQYGEWISNVVHGNLGSSLANGEAVTSLMGTRLVNSFILVIVSGLIGCALGIGIGAYCALREGGRLDRVVSVISLALASLPEFVVAVLVIFLLATGVFHLLPSVSILQPGELIWASPVKIVLPALCLVIVVCPYVLRMTRGTTIEALRSDYCEMAALKGMTRGSVVRRHALPNTVPAVSQVIGIIFLYLAGGIVIVEYVFNYPGIGAELVQAVQARDVPQIQAIVLGLAAFYVVVNIATDTWAIMMTPRRRIRR